MPSLEYVDLATARDARGTRIVTSALVPSPWSEATKGLFALAGLPALVVARPREAAELTAWTGIDNVPAVRHDDEPVRTSWAAILGLAARLAGPGVLVPVDPAARAEEMGLVEMIAGEDGIGWSARLAMIHIALRDGRGFPAPVATYLAKRYGHGPSVEPAALREHVGVRLRVLGERLASRQARGETYFGGARASALDVYAAAFLTPLSEIDDAACPQMIPPLRAAFGTARELLGDLVPARLWEHRTMMFERHLAWPIRLA
jgi:glutathione S-transferase